VAAVSVQSCAARGSYHPAERSARASSRALYAAALRALEEGGVTVETKDVDGGILVTAWERGDDFSIPMRYRWRVIVDDGRVRVLSDCQNQGVGPFDSKDWKPCDQQPAERGAEASRLADEIAATARTEPTAAPPASATSSQQASVPIDAGPQ